MHTNFSWFYFILLFYLNSSANSEAFSPVYCLEMKNNKVLLSVCSDFLCIFYFDIINRNKLHQKWETVVWRSSVKMVFIGKHLCQSLVFCNDSGIRPAAILKRDSGAGVFLRILRIFEEHFFYIKHISYLAATSRQWV